MVEVILINLLLRFEYKDLFLPPLHWFEMDDSISQKSDDKADETGEQVFGLSIGEAYIFTSSSVYTGC